MSTRPKPKITVRVPDVIPPERQFLIAGVGEGWDGEEGTCEAIVRSLGGRKLPSGVSVHEFGTGALDIAYDVMRGYDALILIDVSPGQGSQDEVVTADETEIDASIEDGQDLNPHAMDVPTVLHFIKNVGGWPGRILIVPCQPGAGEDGATRAVDLVLETIDQEIHRA